MKLSLPGFTCIWFSCLIAQAAVTGSISGTVKDPTGNMIAGATVTATNTAQGIGTKTTTDAKGEYSLPSLAVGTYEIDATSPGFRPEKRSGLNIDANSALQVDLTLQVAEQREEVTVSGTGEEVHAETASTQVGQVVTSQEMTTVALNGRSFTDLMALQPGIVPMSTQTPDSIVMAGASVAIAPSGGLNPGNQSISGQREDANGFLVNGGDVKELMNGGTTIVPDLDSIEEFRVLTNNFDAEYGNHSGGIVNVVTKSGGNDLHGSAFEFLRNTSLDARNFFSPERSFYRQNQFGGTAGGAIRKNKLFYFADYQGTRSNQGIDTGLISVPSLAERAGNVGAANLTGNVGGPYLANLLSQKLGYTVTSGEPYASVFPGGIIPRSAWSAPAQHLLPYIPLPNAGPGTFSSGTEGQKLRDDKGSFRIDGNSDRWGLLSAYYFIDDFFQNNPYPTGQGGASVPGFSGLNLGRSQLLNLGDTKTFGGTTVNELRLSFMRDANNVGQPAGGVGPSLASQGFLTGVGTPGIVPLAPSIEGIENIVFNSFTMGTPITNLIQKNNTYAVSDNLSKVTGGHTIKLGIESSLEQVNVNPNPTFNGSFKFAGSETGLDFADFLIGVPSQFNQADSQAYYGRHKYAGGFAQDSWRIRTGLTVNYGIRWDLMQYWSEKFNQIPTFNPGEQSQAFPTAPTGLVYPGDRGVPSTLVPEKNRFAPRFGIAFSPNTSSGWLGKLLGGPGATSVRAGYGIFYSEIQGNTIAFDEPQPPYGLSYTSPGPPLFAEPFRTASNGVFGGNPFPLNFPPFGASPSHPITGINFAPFEPQAGMTAPPPWNTIPYTENYFLSIERQLGQDTLLDVSYVGSQSHHLLAIYSANPGIPSLCLATPGCGPFAEDTYGTRRGLGPAFSNDDYDASIANSNYNSLQVTVRHSSKRLMVLLSYTYSKSIDQASSLSDPLNPFNFSATRALSAWDLTHGLVASYDYQLPLEKLSKHGRVVTQGWEISGITRASTGFPVSLHSDGDNSLMGSIPNGVNLYSLDLPDYSGAPLNLNGNPRNGLPYFNTAAFRINALGTPGNASRRSFYGPGMFNSDIALLRNFKITESKTLQFRLESFNTFNHAQFFGPAAVSGDINSPLFGQVVKAAAPRLMQIALKFTF